MPVSATDPSRSLEQQIGDTERRLGARRHAACTHMATAKQRVRARLQSPWTLLAAFGFGIALGQFTSRDRRRRDTAAPARDAGAPRSAGALSMLLGALRVAAPVMAIISALDKSVAAPPAARTPRQTQEER
jgi:hypothetical protein